jgi:hypothetical protein
MAAPRYSPANDSTKKTPNPVKMRNVATPFWTYGGNTGRRGGARAAVEGRPAPLHRRGRVSRHRLGARCSGIDWDASTCLGGRMGFAGDLIKLT